MPGSASALIDYLRALRKSRGMTQVDLSEAAQVPVSTIKAFEAGGKGSVTTLVNLYEEGFKKHKKLTADERHKLCVEWLLLRVPGLNPDTLRAATLACKPSDHGTTAEDEAIISKVTEVLTGRYREKWRKLLGALVELA